MYKTALATINSFSLINKGDKIICALSGGPDSMALLFFLNEIKEEYGIKVSAVHVNHMLRGAESDADALFVEHYCKCAGIELLSAKKNVKRFSENKKISVEEAGRILRREAFREGLSRFCANKIAAGHNKNDNAETFLFMLSRGAGTRGLSGIAPITKDGGICIIRPLIDCYRAQIEAYCAMKHIPFVTDSTNSKEIYTRNKIRLSLLPWLEQNLNGDIVGAITSASEIIREQTEFIEGEAKNAFNHCLRDRTDSSLTLSLINFEKYGTALRKLIIREAVKNLNGLKNLTSAHVGAILSLSKKGTGKRVSLPGGIICEIQYDFIILRKNSATQEFCYKLIKDTPVFVKEQNIYVTFSEYQLNADNFKNLYTKMYKCDKIFSEVYYRTRRPGDRIKLPAGTKKLSDYFIDTKTPRHTRDAAALIADGTDVLSVIGICESEYVKYGRNIFFIQFWEDTDGNGRGFNIQRET